MPSPLLKDKGQISPSRGKNIQHTVHKTMSIYNTTIDINVHHYVLVHIRYKCTLLGLVHIRYKCTSLGTSSH